MLHLVMSQKMFTNVEINNNGHVCICITLNFTTSLPIKKCIPRKEVSMHLSEQASCERKLTPPPSTIIPLKTQRNGHGWISKPLLVADFQPSSG